jgi:hypothetical protein
VTQLPKYGVFGNVVSPDSKPPNTYTSDCGHIQTAHRLDTITQEGKLQERGFMPGPVFPNRQLKPNK